MNDDWRVHIDLHDRGIAHRLSESLQASELEHDLERSFSGRVTVSVDGAEVFCYAGSRAQVEAAQTVIERVIADAGWQADVEVARWHPQAERWEPLDEPLPTDPAGAALERGQRIAEQRADSEQQGYPEYEVRIECRSRGQARDVAGQLHSERIPHIRRFNWVLIGADDEDAANRLADRFARELPGTTITVEFNMRAVYDARPGNPFTFLGGLAD